MKVASQASWVDTIGLAAVLERMMLISQAIYEKTSKRLQKASSAYQARYDLEMKIASAKLEAVEAASEIGLAGFLIHTENQKWLPLYEGKNHYKVEESPSGKKIAIYAGGPSESSEDILEVTEEALVVQRAETKKSYVTNHNVEFAGSQYLVKILPLPHRMKTLYRAPAEVIS